MTLFYWGNEMITEIKTAIILTVIIAIGIGGISIVFSSLEQSNETQTGMLDLFFSSLNQSTEFETQTDEKGNVVSLIDKSRYKHAPELVGIADYVNTTPEELNDMIKDKVVLYDIWTYSCINCIRTLPYVTAWNEKYADDGLLVIGIHSPEFEFEKNLNNVQSAVEKYGITYPVVLDNDHQTWKAFDNRYWPRKYITDSEGYIRYDHIGEGAYDQTEKVIQQLLEERANLLGINVASAELLMDLEEFQHTSFRTPELYFGYKFAAGRNQLGNSEGFHPNEIVSYSIPEQLTRDYFYLEGQWENLEDGMKLVHGKGLIHLPYFAKSVNIVASETSNLKILIDGKPISTELAGADVNNSLVHVSEPRLYNLISSKNPENHLLSIEANSPGFEIFTFTFG